MAQSKFGRHSTRSPAQARYRVSSRKDTNKKKKAVREAKRQAWDKEKWSKKPRSKTYRGKARDLARAEIRRKNGGEVPKKRHAPVEILSKNQMLLKGLKLSLQGRFTAI